MSDVGQHSNLGVALVTNDAVGVLGAKWDAKQHNRFEQTPILHGGSFAPVSKILPILRREGLLLNN